MCPGYSPQGWVEHDYRELYVIGAITAIDEVTGVISVVEFTADLLFSGVFPQKIKSLKPLKIKGFRPV